jgi:hypothetical protein
MVVSLITNMVHFGKIENPILSGLDRGTVRAIPLWAHANFQNPTEDHRLVTQEQGDPARVDGSSVRLDAGIRCQLEGLAPKHSPSLSSSYKNSRPAEASSPFAIFPIAKVRTPLHSPPASHRLALPLVDSSCMVGVLVPCAFIDLGFGIIGQLLCCPLQIT